MSEILGSIDRARFVLIDHLNWVQLVQIEIVELKR
jgi:hypothetical protein